MIGFKRQKMTSDNQMKSNMEAGSALFYQDVFDALIGIEMIIENDER